MLAFKELIYGKAYPYYEMCDYGLKFFKNQDSIGDDVLFSEGYPENLSEILHQLSKDGMIIRSRNGATITANGKIRMMSGGYKAEALKGRISFLAVILSAIGGIIVILQVML